MAKLIDVARSLGVDLSEVRAWTTAFSEHLSPDAVAAAADEPEFKEADLRVLAFVAEQVGWVRSPARFPTCCTERGSQRHDSSCSPA